LCSRSSAQAAQARASIGQLEANGAAADIILSQDEQQALPAAASGFVNRRARGRVAVNN
jgi:hypothetical protein